jgi:hypothetical protein
LLPLVSFFTPGLLVTHDGKDHVVRIASFYASLQEGNIVPRWAGNLNWGYGHPIIMFLYPFSSYVASIFRFIGFSFVDATKAVFAVAHIASILSMYLWMSTVWGKRAGFIGALLYGFAPYRFVDLYVRGAIGEHMAFAFPPLICYFLYKLATDVSPKTYDPLLRPDVRRDYGGRVRPTTYYGIGLSISLAFLILSHNAISLMFLPLIGLYVLYLFIFETKKSFCFLLSAFCFLFLGFGLSAFFWIPAFIEGKYTLRNIVTTGEAMDRFVPWTWFFYSPWNYGGTVTLTKSLGIFQWVGIAASFVLIWKTKEKKIRFLLFTFYFLLFTSLFIMTSASSLIWKQIMILQNFQFPWRFLSLTTFIAAVLGGISISQLLNMIKQKTMNVKHGTCDNKHKTFLLIAHCSLSNVRCLLFFVFCFLLIVSTFHMWRPKGFSLEEELSYTGIYAGTTDTGESSPIWSVRFMLELPKAVIELISGEATVEQIRRTSTLHEYRIVADTRAEFLENTIYFPGWEVLVDGKKINIEFQSEIHRGIMTFWVEKGEHRVTVIFRDTKLRKISSAITIISGIVLILGCFIAHFLWKRKK